MDFHKLSDYNTLEYFHVEPEFGLNDEQVEENREKYGTNELIAIKKKKAIILLLEQFNNPIIYILIIAAIINGLVADAKDAMVIWFVVFLNTLIGFFQERRASNALQSLRKMAAPVARVIRNGENLNIPTAEVVVGDIISLESGVRSPADIRLVDSKNLTVDESMLTGESFAIHKNHDVILEENAPLGDRINMVYSGTIIQKGRGIGVAVNVGRGTEFGKISQKVAETEESISPLQKQIANFGKGLSLAILFAVIAIFIVGFLRGNDWITMFMTAIGLAVSAIPEGLPVAVTITLSIGIYQMAKHKAIVKKLSAVETLGSTNVICTDKTGTLTKNQMTATKLFIAHKEYNVSGSGYLKEGKVFRINSNSEVNFNENKAFEIFSLIGAYCTESTLTDTGTEWNITGDPTEAALMITVKKLGYNNNGYKVFKDIPFESENQLMAVRIVNGEESYSLVKGAPEKIIKRCKSMVDKNGNEQKIDELYLKQIVENFSKDGLRVLALAYSDTNPDEHLSIDNLQNLKFIGFAGIEDSVRPEAIQAVDDCNKAGIKVVMITGDHVTTARSVAKSVNIARNGEMPFALTGQELDEMSDEELFRKVPDVQVYARVAPQHKYRIVEQLQRHNQIVAMTGDGVNDAPALKKADIGVAMGSGTDVAKEASHMVLLDDNFATIVQAVRRGRVVLSNLKHILLYILATSFGGLLTIAASVAIGIPLPLLPAQLLWVNLVTDGTSTFPLGFEKEHGNVMLFKPRKKNDPLITKEIILRISFAGLLMMIGTLGVFYFSAEDIFNPSTKELVYAQTMAFCTLAFFQIWNVQNSRSLDRSLFFNLPAQKLENNETKIDNQLDRIGILTNPILFGVMFLAIFLQVLAVELPIMNDLLHTAPLGLNDWLIVIGVSFSIIVAVEIGKFLYALKNKLKHI